MRVVVFFLVVTHRMYSQAIRSSKYKDNVTIVLGILYILLVIF